MKILVIGSGGREHALAWRLSQPEHIEKVYVAPGNGGTQVGKLENLPITDFEELASFVQTEQIALTVVGPEAPLAAGIVDFFSEKGLPIFGPRKAAAQLESSKDYAKAFMFRHHIPTAEYATFSDAKKAHDYLNQHPAPIVIKADGLAAGKGVIVAMTDEQAHQAVDDMLEGNSMGQAGSRVVIEEFLEGEEASFIVLSDGKNILPLATSQDHKRLKDHDEGPNTGGMGAYSPAPIVSDTLHRRIMKEVIEPSIQGMAKDGLPYTGFLYAGLMIGPGDDEHRSIKVLEFNCRMGDPETQPIMMRIKNDFSKVLCLACNGKLNEAHIEWDPRTALGVVLAAPGYPEKPVTGQVITHLPSPNEHLCVFYAGTKLNENKELISSGGRVLCVTALGDSVESTRHAVYQAIADIHFPDCQYRTDIAWRALKRS
ncbi:phosphoribosylamine--glycine ligase [Basilea psittacipulmonis]|uniref:Phosphoribosylamine--glycine ligase n=1 Tax=Basilea psittacipulmonis DSM 24701 TaxID=1072685 RepID=A0A077DH45_9BURK|nr:phosphoribosylamine--glycine ligase [Basilea psittacipulmonis]AIL32747.1 phosphoribosylamine--glycine ligase [Basilea psittacipulmonis DSM 24701]